MTVSVRGQLVWGPDVALGQVGKVFGQFLICQGEQGIPAVSYLRIPLHFSISTSYFLLEFSTNAYL